MTEKNTDKKADKRPVTQQSDTLRQDFPWGHIDWYHAAELSGSEGMTLGRVTINPGESNASHGHPNCEEVLYLLSGELVHTYGDEEHRLRPGDAICIPPNVDHQAHNVSDEPAVMIVAYNSAYRRVKATGEDSEGE